MRRYRDPYLTAKLCLIALLWLAVYVTGSAVNRRLVDFPDGLALPPAEAADLPPLASNPGGTVGLPAVSGAVPGCAGISAGGSPAVPVPAPPEGPSFSRPVVAVPGSAGVSPASSSVVGATDPAIMSRLDAEALFRIAADKALRGDFGPLRPWQRRAYERGLRSCHADLVRMTVYGPWEGYDRNEGCAYGLGCNETVAASNTLPGLSVIWVPYPAHLRAIGDTGAAWNDPTAREEGCRYWVDLWIPYRGWNGLQDTVYRRHVVVLGRG